MADVKALLKLIRHLHELIREAVVRTCERAALDALAHIAQDAEGDTGARAGARYLLSAI